MDVPLIVQILLSGLTVGSIYALIAVGLTVALSTSGLLNSLHGEFVVLGGILSVTFYKAFGLPLPIAVLLSIVALAIVGALVYFGLISPMIRKRAGTLLVVILTLGATKLLWSPEFLIWGDEPLNLPTFMATKTVPLLGAAIQTQALWTLGISAVVVILLRLFYNRTKLGQALLACSINRDAASLVGINIGVMFLAAFIASGVLAAVAGTMMTSLSYMRYDLGLALLLKGFAGAVIGGMGNITGAVVGSLALGLLESVGTGLVEAGYRDAIAFSVVLLFLLFYPRGLFGSHLVEE